MNSFSIIVQVNSQKNTLMKTLGTSLQISKIILENEYPETDGVGTQILQDQELIWGDETKVNYEVAAVAYTVATIYPTLSILIDRQFKNFIYWGRNSIMGKT